MIIKNKKILKDSLTLNRATKNITDMKLNSKNSKTSKAILNSLKISNRKLMKDCTTVRLKLMNLPIFQIKNSKKWKQDWRFNQWQKELICYLEITIKLMWTGLETDLWKFKIKDNVDPVTLSQLPPFLKISTSNNPLVKNNSFPNNNLLTVLDLTETMDVMEDGLIQS